MSRNLKNTTHPLQPHLRLVRIKSVRPLGAQHSWAPSPVAVPFPHVVPIATGCVPHLR